MRAGLLKYRIDIYSIDSSLDDYGANQQQRTYRGSIKAQKSYKSRNRVSSDVDIYYNDELTFIFRKQINLDNTCIIVYEGLDYRILDIQDENNAYTVKVQRII